MFTKRSSALKFNFLALNAIISITLVIAAHHAVHNYPTTSVSLYSHADKLEEKLASNEDSAERQSFQQFIRSKPGSTMIGKLKPNATALELMLLKDKIAKTILGFQGLDKASGPQQQQLDPITESECYIEVTKVERIAGKCSKVNNGLPVCQSDNYMALNNDCD